MSRPVCVACQVEYRPEKNEVVVEYMSGDDSYQLFYADLWRCPKCNHLMITGFAGRSLAEHWQPDYEDRRKRFAADGVIYKVFEH